MDQDNDSQLTNENASWLVSGPMRVWAGQQQWPCQWLTLETGQQGQYQHCVACTTPPLHTHISRFQTTPSTAMMPLQRTYNILVSFTEVRLQRLQRTWQPETWTLLISSMLLHVSITAWYCSWCRISWDLQNMTVWCVTGLDTGWMEMTLNTNVTIQWFWK